ncbi:hypothetical protein R6Q59_035355 [Mikania micrantha]
MHSSDCCFKPPDGHIVHVMKGPMLSHIMYADNVIHQREWLASWGRLTEMIKGCTETGALKSKAGYDVGSIETMNVGQVHL